MPSYLCSQGAVDMPALANGKDFVPCKSLDLPANVLDLEGYSNWKPLEKL